MFNYKFNHYYPFNLQMNIIYKNFYLNNVKKMIFFFFYQLFDFKNCY